MKLSHWGRVMGPVGLVLLVASILTIFVAGDTWLGMINIGLGLGCVAFYLVTNFGELTGKLTGRGAFYTGTSLVASALLVGGLAAANYLAVAHPKSWDVTKNKIHTLSEDTVHTVQNLKEPVEVLAFFKPGEPQGDMYEGLFQRYHALSDKFAYRMLDPEKEPVLVKELDLHAGGPRVVVRLGKLDAKVAQPTEEDLTNALVKVTHEVQKKVYFLQGHGEAQIDDRAATGYAKLAERMADEGLQAEALPFGKGDIPSDAAAVIIAGPQKPLLDSEVASLRKYLDGGGRVIAMLDPLTPNGLDGLLKDWGIAQDPGVIVDQAGRSRFDSPFAAVGAAYSQHAATKGFNLVTVFPQATSLSTSTVSGVTDTPLVFTLGTVGGQSVSWVEGAAGGGENGPSADTKKGPLTLAVLATRAAKADPKKEGRLLVIGDHDFATNGNLPVLGNGDFALNTMNYMVDQTERISIRPRTRDASRLFLSKAQMGGIRFFATELPIGLLALGLAIFFNRRAK